MRGIKSKFPSRLPYCNEGKRRCSNLVWGEKGKTPFRTSHVLAYSQEKKRQETRECCSIPIDRIFLFLLLYIVSLSDQTKFELWRGNYTYIHIHIQRCSFIFSFFENRTGYKFVSNKINGKKLADKPYLKIILLEYFLRMLKPENYRISRFKAI